MNLGTANGAVHCRPLKLSERVSPNSAQPCSANETFSQRLRKGGGLCSLFSVGAGSFTGVVTHLRKLGARRCWTGTPRAQRMTGPALESAVSWEERAASSSQNVLQPHLFLVGDKHDQGSSSLPSVSFKPGAGCALQKPGADVVSSSAPAGAARPECETRRWGKVLAKYFMGVLCNYPERGRMNG